MQIIDAHFHCRTEIESFHTTARFAGHENSIAHLEQVWKENNIIHGIVMGNKGVDLENHIYPYNMSYCIGLDGSCIKDLKTKQNYYLEMVEKYFQKDACVGLKLYPGYCPYYVYDKIYFPFYELAEKYLKPVAIHSGETSRSDAFLKYSHPLTLDEVAAKFPNVTFILCHFGNPWLADAAAVMSKNPNVVADLSGILVGNPNITEFLKENKTYFDYLKMWLSYVNNYERFLFGTDWPIINIPVYIQFISELIPKKYHDMVFYENAKRIYKL